MTTLAERETASVCRIALVNLPFAAVDFPSLALTQLRTRLTQRFGLRVNVDILYLNQDIATFLGLDLYRLLTGSIEHHHSGIGDWFFRQAAFPDLPDNAADYFARHYPATSIKDEIFRRLILDRRSRLDDVLDDLIDRYQLDDRDLVGFTSMFAQNVACFALARRLKARRPGIVTIMGGANCETVMGREIVRQIDVIDFVFSGPALVTLPDFVRCRIEGDDDACHRLDGIFSRRNVAPGSSFTPAPLGAELPIDVPVGLDYDSFLRSLEERFRSGEVTPALFFETSRGCWWGQRAHCTFCGLNGTTMTYRAMSPAHALEYFDQLFAYAPRCSRFHCVDNIMPKSYPSEVFAVLSPPPNVELFYEVKADLTADEMRVLSAAHVTLLQPGIEALATSTLRLMRKGTSVFQNLAFLQQCVIHGIQPAWNLLVGFPGEDEAVYRKYLADLPLLAHLPPPSGVFPVRFDRYSPYFTEAKRYGLDLRPFDFYGLIYPFDEEALRNLAYHFVDRNEQAAYVTTWKRWIEPLREKFETWSARWHGGDGQPPAQLFLQPGAREAVVYDSRGVDPVEHRIGERGRLVLARLSHPLRAADVAAQLRELDGFDPEATLVDLERRRLVFREGERLMSLVLPGPRNAAPSEANQVEPASARAPAR